jgi:hypothetical protein
VTTKPGVLASALVGILLLAFAVSVNFPKANGGAFKGDESTYYLLGLSLARDFDFKYQRKDLVRVWEEYSGPQGIFLKRGKDIDISGSSEFPFVRWQKREDPERETRLYFSKSFIYPLAAAPFVYLFGTNGFLVLHALLVALDLLVIYLFIHAATKSNWVALPLAVAFLGVSVVPVYFVWLVPELFNFSLALYAVFFWAYKEVARGANVGRTAALMADPASDHIAAVLIGLATFSKPPHLLLLVPVVLLIASRRQWQHAFGTIIVCGAITASLFAANAAITGEFNYQGGDRKTFYHFTGFPFANTWETFDNIGPVRGREDLLLGDVLVNAHTGTVLGHNLWYFLAGRNAGLLPYFFPGVLAMVLFLFSRQKQLWQWLALATIAGVVLMHVFVWPFTWNGGGGPVGSRYFLAFYALFLVLIPATAGVGAAIAAFIGGALFTAQILLNPFYVSLRPGEHTKSGPLRLLPIELTLLHDLPVAQDHERMRRPVGPPNPGPQAFAYFPDDNTFNPEEIPAKSKDYWFWVKGASKAEVVLRGPVELASAAERRWVTKKISRLNIEVRNGGAANRVTIATGRESQTLDLTPGELKSVSLAVSSGVPFRREVQPTSYLYRMSVRTTAGFVPFLENPCLERDKCPPGDPRFLGAMIHVIPEYTDADITTGWVPPGGMPKEEEDAIGVLDTP